MIIICNLRIAKYKYMRTRLSEAQNHKYCYCSVKTVDTRNTYNSCTTTYIFIGIFHGR